MRLYLTKLLLANAAIAPVTSPYAALRQRMDILCRAASLSLTNMLRSGQLDRRNTEMGASYLSMVRGTASLQNTLPPRSAEVALRITHWQLVLSLRRTQPHRNGEIRQRGNRG